MGDGSSEIGECGRVGRVGGRKMKKRAKTLASLLLLTSYLPSPIYLEKVLHLGEPQDRTFRSPLPSLLTSKLSIQSNPGLFAIVEMDFFGTEDLIIFVSFACN
jgi:hypothetical protein